MKRICYILFIISSISLWLTSCGAGFVMTLQPETAEFKPAAPPPTEPETTEEPEPSAEEEHDDETVLEVHPRFEEILEINPDIIGQVIIEGTNIDHFAVFSGDNEYYWTRDIYGEDDPYGSVFMDMANRGAVLDENTLLHGHNFQGDDDGMFADLELFKEREFFDENRKIIFNNLYSDMEWEVFAVYIVHVNDYYMLVRFGSYENYLEYLEYIKSTALFFADFEPSEEDKLLSLHTRVYDFNDAHMIVTARLIKKTDNTVN
ncbi:MAG: class B sortase [Oscillospiraceae bacterium]|nr:class B sortase [Oscillospiraceae bacterium]